MKSASLAFLIGVLLTTTIIVGYIALKNHQNTKNIFHLKLNGKEFILSEKQ